MEAAEWAVSRLGGTIQSYLRLGLPEKRSPLRAVESAERLARQLGASDAQICRSALSAIELSPYHDSTEAGALRERFQR